MSMRSLPQDHLTGLSRHGIPTHYANTQFRSRLEATWAAFFDQLDWNWEYEPFDMDSYIPDFALSFHRPLLVEVKPWLSGDDAAAVQAVLDSQPWDGEIWIAGAQLGDFAPDTACGMIRDSDGGWDDAVLRRCAKDHATITAANGSWRCRVCGAHDGNAHVFSFPYSEARRRWQEARNRVQWRAPS